VEERDGGDSAAANAVRRDSRLASPARNGAESRIRSIMRSVPQFGESVDIDMFELLRICRMMTP
jgi:hypothetical protein